MCEQLEEVIQSLLGARRYEFDVKETKPPSIGSSVTSKIISTGE
jgi:hypothetical protein